MRISGEQERNDDGMLPSIGERSFADKTFKAQAFWWAERLGRQPTVPTALKQSSLFKERKLVNEALVHSLASPHLSLET